MSAAWTGVNGAAICADAGTAPKAATITTARNTRTHENTKRLLYTEFFVVSWFRGFVVIPDDETWTRRCMLLASGFVLSERLELRDALLRVGQVLALFEFLDEFLEDRKRCRFLFHPHVRFAKVEVHGVAARVAGVFLEHFFEAL